MATLTVTSRGQVTFRKELLQHLGIQPGDKIEVDRMPHGRIEMRAARRTGKIVDIFGILKGKSKKVATLEEIEEAIRAGWAGETKWDDER
jgi:antitoxin PrlF